MAEVEETDCLNGYFKLSEQEAPRGLQEFVCKTCGGKYLKYRYERYANCENCRPPKPAKRRYTTAHKRKEVSKCPT